MSSSASFQSRLDEWRHSQETAQAAEAVRRRYRDNPCELVAIIVVLIYFNIIITCAFLFEYGTTTSQSTASFAPAPWSEVKSTSGLFFFGINLLVLNLLLWWWCVRPRQQQLQLTLETPPLLSPPPPQLSTHKQELIEQQRETARQKAAELREAKELEAKEAKELAEATKLARKLHKKHTALMNKQISHQHNLAKTMMTGGDGHYYGTGTGTITTSTTTPEQQHAVSPTELTTTLQLNQPSPLPPSQHFKLKVLLADLTMATTGCTVPQLVRNDDALSSAVVRSVDGVVHFLDFFFTADRWKVIPHQAIRDVVNTKLYKLHVLLHEVQVEEDDDEEDDEEDEDQQQKEQETTTSKLIEVLCSVYTTTAALMVLFNFLNVTLHAYLHALPGVKKAKLNKATAEKDLTQLHAQIKLCVAATIATLPPIITTEQLVDDDDVDLHVVEDGALPLEPEPVVDSTLPTTSATPSATQPITATRTPTRPATTRPTKTLQAPNPTATSTTKTTQPTTNPTANTTKTQQPPPNPTTTTITIKTDEPSTPTIRITLKKQPEQQEQQPPQQEEQKQQPQQPKKQQKQRQKQQPKQQQQKQQPQQEQQL